jgi:hypothetical protein
MATPEDPTAAIWVLQRVFEAKPTEAKTLKLLQAVVVAQAALSIKNSAQGLNEKQRGAATIAKLPFLAQRFMLFLNANYPGRLPAWVTADKLQHATTNGKRQLN